MSAQEIMNFLNFNHPVKTDEFHFIDMADNSQIVGYFNSFTNENVISNSWSFTKVFAGDKKIITVNGQDIIKMQKLKTST